MTWTKDEKARVERIEESVSGHSKQLFTAKGAVAILGMIGLLGTGLGVRSNMQIEKIADFERKANSAMTSALDKYGTPKIVTGSISVSTEEGLPAVVGTHAADGTFVPLSAAATLDNGRRWNAESPWRFVEGAGQFHVSSADGGFFDQDLRLTIEYRSEFKSPPSITCGISSFSTRSDPEPADSVSVQPVLAECTARRAVFEIDHASRTKLHHIGFHFVAVGRFPPTSTED